MRGGASFTLADQNLARTGGVEDRPGAKIFLAAGETLGGGEGAEEVFG